MAYLQLLAFFIASAISLAVIYYKLPLNVVQEFIILIIIFLIMTSKKFLKSDGTVSRNFKVLLLLTTSLSVQLLVVSTGAIFSPFLILLHLYTLATSFLLDIQASVGFLIFSISLIASTLWLDPKLKKLLLDDPGSAILYFTSFLVIIPLAYLLMRTYHLKEALSQTLGDLVKMNVKKEGLILGGLKEIIIVVTDQNLKIISSSEALNKLLNKSSEELTDQNLLETIKLTDAQNNSPTKDTLSINQVIKDKVTHIVKGFYLLMENSISKPMSIQISPITNQDGQVTQIAFIFSEADNQRSSLHVDLIQARKQNKLLFEGIKQTLANTSSSLVNQAQLYQNHEEDLNLAEEIEDHRITLNPKLSEMAYLINQVVRKEASLAKVFNLELKFNIPDKERDKESAYFGLIESKTSSLILPYTSFSVLVDADYFNILIQKIIDLAIFITDAKASPLINISVSSEDKFISINIEASNLTLDELDFQSLFIPYYGNKFLHTNIKFSSGLEGYIGKIIATQLETDIKHDYNKSSGVLNLKLQIAKKINH